MELIATLLVFPLVCLLASGSLPSRFANANVKVLRRALTYVVAFESLLALMLVIGYAATGATPFSITVWENSPGIGLNLGVYIDGVSSLMLLLVSYVGFVVSRYSIRYLDGEARQGSYFCWLAFTIGAVSLMVLAGGLLLFFAAWVMTSFGLHQLLLHYRHRAAAHRAARTKFAISRLGDAFLIAALFLVFKTFGTFELQELFKLASDFLAASETTASHKVIGWLFVLGALTKSAQFPFHVWLPDTMETPTPVSALMHAGIVNAGGYLIIRMSPLVAFAPEALAALAAIGTFTACFAGVVMMTQPAVKRALAYSTIAQMGFMMLQCGLGAYTAAMLHILAHSLYKAHAFLSSGNVISQALAVNGAKTAQRSSRVEIISLVFAAIATLFAYVIVSMLFGLHSSTKSGGFVLAFILFLALTTWSWRLFTLNELMTRIMGVLGLVLLCLVYDASYLAIHHVIAQTASIAPVSPSPYYLPIGIVLCFGVLFVLHTIVISRLRPSWLEAMRVHASNGFYIDAIYHRMLFPIVRA